MFEKESRVYLISSSLGSCSANLFNEYDTDSTRGTIYQQNTIFYETVSQKFYTNNLTFLIYGSFKLVACLLNPANVARYINASNSLSRLERPRFGAFIIISLWRT